MITMLVMLVTSAILLLVTYPAARRRDRETQERIDEYLRSLGGGRDKR